MVNGRLPGWERGGRACTSSWCSSRPSAGGRRNCARRSRVHAAACLENEPGCRRYDISVDPLEGASFLLYQVYDDEAAYLAHRELPHYADFRILDRPVGAHAPRAHL